jgi:hypothetical protein
MREHGVVRWSFVFLLLLLAVVVVSDDAFAQDPCGVGTRVQLKGSSTGTIAEIGTESPHVGWYRIVFSWSPGGEWYDPRTWEMTVAGTSTVCGKPAQASAPKPAAPSASAAAQKACMVGSRVQLKDGPTGTIAEIGTESPHVGWYRIVFSWSPGGEWYDPRTWEMTIAGTNIKCRQAPAPARAPSQSTPRTAPARPGTAPKQEPSAAGPAGCSMAFPAGNVTKSSPASAATFQRVIYDREAGRINPGSITAPKQIGLTFLSFELGERYENTLTSTRFGDKRRHDGAPQGATIYPVRTRELMCERHGQEIRRTVRDVSRDCFKNRDGNWSCPGRTTKTIESRLIPAQ